MTDIISKKLFEELGALNDKIGGIAFSLLSARSSSGGSITLAYPVDITVVGSDDRKSRSLTIDSIGQFGYCEFAFRDSQAKLLVSAPHGLTDVYGNRGAYLETEGVEQLEPIPVRMSNLDVITIIHSAEAALSYEKDQLPDSMVHRYTIPDVRDLKSSNKTFYDRIVESMNSLVRGKCSDYYFGQLGDSYFWFRIGANRYCFPDFEISFKSDGNGICIKGHASSVYLSWKGKALEAFMPDCLTGYHYKVSIPTVTLCNLSVALNERCKNL